MLLNQSSVIRVSTRNSNVEVSSMKSAKNMNCRKEKNQRLVAVVSMLAQTLLICSAFMRLTMVIDIAR